MTAKNPVGRLAETAISTLKNPIGAAGKVVDQAKGTVALGKVVAETAGSVVVRAAGRKPGRATHQAPASFPADLRPVPDVNEPAGTQAPGTQERGAEDSPKKHGDPLAYKREADLVHGAPGTAKKTAKKTAAKKTAAKKTAAKKTAPKKTAAKRTAKKVTATPADVAEVVEAAVAEDPARTAAAPAPKQSATKAPAKKSARKTTPGGRLPAKKAQPKSAAELVADEDTDVRTPSGIPAADSAQNPDTAETSLTQPGTEPLVDPGTAKATRSETETLRKAAEKNPE